MSYFPKGKVAAVIAHMSHHPDRDFTREELAPIIGCEPVAVGAYLGAARRYNALHARKVRGANVFRINPFDADREADPPPEFRAALWSDGDLTLNGCTMGEDPGTVFLSAAQVQTIMQLCLHGAGQKVAEA